MSRFNFDFVPQQVWDDLRYEIGRNGLEYDDNWRAYNFDTGEGKAEYIAAANRGCCGVFESQTKVDGIKWIIGCNHGH